MNLNVKLREYRMRRGLTLEEVANAVGVAKSTVKKWESGQIQSMRISKIADLSKVLCVSPLSLIFESEEAALTNTTQTVPSVCDCFSDRLKQIMRERNLRQIDIINRCRPYCEKYGVRLESNDMSQYVSGRSKPNQIRLTILGLALGVSEVWLMGYDVPMDRTDCSVGVNNGVVGNGNHHNTVISEQQPAIPTPPIISCILTICNSLSEADQAKVLAYATDLLSGKKES